MIVWVLLFLMWFMAIVFTGYLLRDIVASAIALFFAIHFGDSGNPDIGSLKGWLVFPSAFVDAAAIVMTVVTLTQ